MMFQNRALFLIITSLSLIGAATLGTRVKRQLFISLLSTANDNFRNFGNMITERAHLLGRPLGTSLRNGVNVAQTVIQEGVNVLEGILGMPDSTGRYHHTPEYLTTPAPTTPKPFIASRFGDVEEEEITTKSSAPWRKHKPKPIDETDPQRK